MAAIPPKVDLEGFKKSMCDGVDGAFKRGVKYGRYLEREERPVDAVPRDEFDAIMRRFQHLLESDYIRSFDEYDPQTQTYKRDIAEAIDPVDRVVCCHECEHWGRSPFGHPMIGWCMIAGRHRSPDYYCADGRRRE